MKAATQQLLSGARTHTLNRTQHLLDWKLITFFGAAFALCKRLARRGSLAPYMALERPDSFSKGKLNSRISCRRQNGSSAAEINIRGGGRDVLSLNWYYTHAWLQLQHTLTCDLNLLSVESRAYATHARLSARFRSRARLLFYNSNLQLR